ncbi:MFS transporter [Variovorax sp. RKNM96]|uniref:MFS transporter n=1 Tax=Variovorax sp. RKNM96 TaxID=2681552 RepID=UPI00197CBD00|nr:MFS transporter [Variovorax sp. RKNM96]
MTSSSDIPRDVDAAGQLERRIDELPMSRHLWALVLLLSLGTFFETYELSLTSLISPGLIQSGIFAREHGLLDLPDQATFAAATFLGMFVGAMVLGRIADQIGRKRAFTSSIAIYTTATLLMSLQHSSWGIDLCRFIAGIGLGAEIVTVDAYLAEIVPARFRGRAFAFATFVQFLAVPITGGLSYMLVPLQPLGMDGWRWVCLIGAVGGVLVLLTRTLLPESPRWLARRGSLQRATQVIGLIEKKSGVVPVPLMHTPVEMAPSQVHASVNGAAPKLFDSEWRGRISMLTLAHVFITIGFFGLASWLPALLAAQGHSIVKSFQFTFYISLCYPLCPLLFMWFADRIERKWQLVFGTLASAVFGVALGQQTESVGIVAFGLGVTVCNLLVAYSIHTYQSELFPSSIRARAVGFVYSWGRLATVFSSFLIGYLLQSGGTAAVFTFLAFCFVAVSVLIAVLGPRTMQQQGRA